eukprot:3112132-Pyramimonas_sp.AAC.1
MRGLCLHAPCARDANCTRDADDPRDARSPGAKMLGWEHEESEQAHNWLWTCKLISIMIDPRTRK